MEKMDYYKILNIKRDATQDDIKAAYRKLAKQYHPDKFATAPEEKKREAEEKFKEIQHAYDVLSDTQKKAAYDQYGSEDGPNMNSNFGGGFNPFGGGFSTIFEDMFSAYGNVNTQAAKNPDDKPGEDIKVELKLTFEEAAFGAKDKSIVYSRLEKCEKCSGTGAADSASIKTCQDCHGSGVTFTRQQTPFGIMQAQTICKACGGRGKIVLKKCACCNGTGRIKKQHTIKINIPAGVESDQMLTIKNEGNMSRGSGLSGNLIVIFNVLQHKLFKRNGTTITLDVPITVTQAILGANIQVPTPDGSVLSIDITPGTQTGDTKTFIGRGAKSLRHESFGDFIIRFIVDTPINLTTEQKELLKKLGDFGTSEQVSCYNKLLQESL